MRTAKADANQPEIIRALRAIGCSVVSLHRVGGGVPDLLVGYHGRNYLLEVKMPGQGLRSAAQQSWHSAWRGQVAIVHSTTEALLVVSPRRCWWFRR